MQASSRHTFHIPVMGLAYTIDSPIKVARFGISSVMSIVEDNLIEMMRNYYYQTANLDYRPITINEPDYRAKRITDYLNLVNTIVQDQVDKLKTAAFEKGSEIARYFEMLPENSTLKQVYQKMMNTGNPVEKNQLETYLRSEILPGSIDVNIMTKIDRDKISASGDLIDNGSDAIAALRGYVKSNLSNSSVIFSAGMNPRLYNYLESCPEFDINEDGFFSKKVVIKVSDYRSALIQGKYLAKKGIWVSEFRIESGLNCGGHAFATEGYLLGPILEEFKSKKQELIDALFEIYKDVQLKKNSRDINFSPEMIFSVQGGIGTHEEDDFLHNHYDIKSTGWGTPFLLVPEATTVDEETLQLLCAAKEKDLVLSRNSPLGVRFHYLKGTSSDKEKARRISKGNPGSPCTEKHLAFNTEFTKEPICTASHKYQKLKINQLQSLHLPEAEYETQLKEVLDKECLCIGLSNAAAINYKQTFVKKLNSVTICPGPNIVNFSSVVSLQQMTDHIYGRENILVSSKRPHMFIAELRLYVDFLKEQLKTDTLTGEISKKKKYYSSFCANMRNGLSYYHQLPVLSESNRDQFIESLEKAENELTAIESDIALALS